MNLLVPSFFCLAISSRNGFASVILVLLLLGAAGCHSDVPEANPDQKENSTSSRIPQPPFELPARIDAEMTNNRPELVLFIVIDTLRADHVGVYGSKKNLTPTIDRLAENAFIFDNAMATSSWTRPSVASMFTSCYPGSIHVETKFDPLPDDLLTLAELLSVYGGYFCAGVTSNGNAGPGIGFAQGFDEFIFPAGENFSKDHMPITAEVITNTALKKLPEWYRNNKGRPLFLFLHYVDPHDPYVAHEGLLDAPEPDGRFSGSRDDLYELDKLQESQVDEKDLDRIRHLYAGEVRYCDLWIRKLFEGMAETGYDLHKNMMLIVTSDHGEGLWDHGARGHGAGLHVEQIHVPLVIQLPNRAGMKQQRIRQPVSLIDLAPTILSVCGVPKPAQFQGHDLCPLMEGERRDKSISLIYSELKTINSDLDALLWKGKKVIRNRDGKAATDKRFELYDLLDDPYEMKDLSQSETPRPWKKTLLQGLKTWSEEIQCKNERSMQINLDDLDEATLKNLRALGYIGN